MNTPAHAVVNLLILGRKYHPGTAAPIVIGSILPDLPMIYFYVYQKALRGAPEPVIWRGLYYDERWQAFFDVFNSIPIVLVGLVIAWWAGAVRWRAFSAGMGLHVLVDLPLHQTDAHWHFFPYFGWRFYSPVSYWDPDYYGEIVSACERFAVAAAAWCCGGATPSGAWGC